VIARGILMSGNQEWEVRIDGRRVTCQSNGLAATIPGIPAPEGQKRYTLALHELIAAEDRDLAQLVVNASTGYDLNAADRALRYWLGGMTLATNLYKEYQKAKKEYDDLCKGQEALQSEHRRLAELISEKEQAEAAAALLRWNQKLLDFVRSRDLLTQANAILAEMPLILETLSGTESGDLGRLQEQLVGLRSKKEVEEGAILEAEQRRTALRISGNGLREGLIVELEGRISGLAELERAIAADERGEADASAREQAMLNRLGAEPDFVAWEGPSFVDLDELDRALQLFHQALSRKDAMAAMVRVFEGAGATVHLPAPEDLLVGIRTLLAWLKETRQQGPNQAPLWAIWLLAVLGVASSLVVLRFGWIGLIGILLIAGAVGLIYAIRGRTTTDRGTDRRSEYTELGLPAPVEWTEASVNERVKTLADDLSEARWQQKVKERLDAYRSDLGDLQNELARIATGYEELRSALVLAPAMPEGDIRSYDGLYWFVHNVVSWHKCHLERVGLAEALEKRRKRAAAVLDEINEQLKEAREQPGEDGKIIGYGGTAEATVEPIKDSASAIAFRQKLEADEQIWREAGLVIDHSRKNIAGIQEQQAVQESAIRDLYTKTGVEEGEDESVRALAAQVEGYQKAVQQRDVLSAVLNAHEAELRASSLFSSREHELESMDLAHVQQRTTLLEMKAGTLEEINRQIESMRTRIAMAEAGNSLETALKRVDDTVADLELEYDSRLASMTGKLLTNALKRQADEQDRPQVFRAADSLLGRITLGRYRLRLRTGEPSAFAAYDTVERQWKELDQLSTGTRIQLLLSVRLAFLGAQETTVSLPIIADELMATSDPERASAIIEALAEISREGRQVFYFTSQKEELDRWKAFLEGKPDLTMKQFMLGSRESEAYGMNLERPAPEMAGSYLLDIVPEPGEMDHAQYGAALQPGVFDPMRDEPGRLHVWYLFTDPVIIYDLLKKGLVHWSQVEMYREAGGIVDSLGKELMEETQSKVAILERFLELYRQGRALRIDRSVLERSGAVSGQFIDPLSELLESLAGNPVQLIASLEKGEIVGFRNRKKDQLKEYFIENHIIPMDVRLDEREIWTRLLAYISRKGIGLEDAQAFVATVLGV